MEIIIVSAFKIFLREVAHKLFGRKGLIFSILFYLIVPVLMQIIVRRAEWGTLGFKNEGNLVAIGWGMIIGVLWMFIVYLLSSRVFPGALKVFNKQMESENFKLKPSLVLFTLFSSFCAVLFYVGYFSILLSKVGVSAPEMGFMIGLLFAAVHYFFLLENLNYDGLIAFILAYFGTMAIVGYSYIFTHNILTAWMCWFSSRVSILIFTEVKTKHSLRRA